MARERQCGFACHSFFFRLLYGQESCKENILAFNILFDILFLYTELKPPQLFIRVFYLWP